MTSKTRDTKGEFLPKQGPALSLRFLRGWLRRKLPLTPRFQKCHQVRLAFDCCFDVKSLKYTELCHLRNWSLDQRFTSWNCHPCPWLGTPTWKFQEMETVPCGHWVKMKQTAFTPTVLWKYNMLPSKLKQNIKHDSIAWMWLWCHEMFVRKVGLRVEDGHVP